MNDHSRDPVPLLDASGLTRTTARAYVREPHVVTDIADMRARPRALWVREANERAPEAVVHLVRLAILGQDDQTAWLLVEGLLKRSARYLVRRLGKWSSLSSADRDDVISSLTCRAVEEWRSLDAQYEFWEVRFWSCLSRRLLDCVRTTAPWIGGCVERAPGSCSDDDERDPVADTTGPSVEERAVAMAALAQLPSELRRVVWLKYYDACTDDEIGEMLGVSGRTVRNHLVRARNMLSADLERGEPR